jgi:hypothetical protein
MSIFKRVERLIFWHWLVPLSKKFPEGKEMLKKHKPQMIEKELVYVVEVEPNEQ